jgi:2'-5' RNA ligase
MTRTFIALELNATLQHYLGAIIRRMKQELPALAWVDPTGIHLTLAFLGELSDEQLSQAFRAAELAARKAAPFDFRLSQPGVFGAPRQPRVIWIGVDEPSGKLLQLQQQLNLELTRQGFEVDTRPFSPHLTLSRVKASLKAEELQSLHRLLTVKESQPSPPDYHVRHLSVMKSELSRTGTIYTCLHHVILGLNGA